MTMLLLFIGLGIGFATAKLHNNGKIWQGNLLFGTFVLALLGWLVYSLVSVLIEYE